MGLPLFFLAFLFLSSSVSSESHLQQQQQNFIIRVRNDLKPIQFSTPQEWYGSILLNTFPAKNSTKNTNILHIYETVFHGFSALLTRRQIRVLKTRPEILGVFPDRILKIQTTRTPHFLGLDNDTGRVSYGLLNRSNYGSDVIIGMMDTGISPEHRSFRDDGMDPIPARWKGECKGGANFPQNLCNKKLIGVRYYHRGFDSFRSGSGSRSRSNQSAIDTDGHGTHTASTAAGRAMRNASLLGFASGEATGIAPKARIAVYKVCWFGQCAESDVLAGVDAAVNDGVDIISMSLGGPPSPYWADLMATATFTAMEKGIFVSVAGGNAGPYSGIVSNVSPWMTTVGASTLDRTFDAVLELGNGNVIVGSSLYDGSGLSKQYPVIYAGNTVSCAPGNLDPSRVRGKIVVCDGYSSGVDMGLAVRDAGGVGVVVFNTMRWAEDLLAEAYMTPGLRITYSAGQKLLEYLGTDPNPVATMTFRGTQVGTKPAPVVAAFSSRGPNVVSLNILKPDVIAPGVNILAAWPNTVPPSLSDRDTRRTEFNIISGTSMACPHVSGIAALLKGAHPEWSPAAIKSALMTTSYFYDTAGHLLFDNKNVSAISDPWSRGAGHVDPMVADDPGLIYNITADDYVDFLCASGLTSKQMETVTGRAVICSTEKTLHPWDLNYPAISVAFNASAPSDFGFVVNRTVTNVGDAESVYSVSLLVPDGVNITVDQDTLDFRKKGEQKSFTVKISAENVPVPAGSTRSKFGALFLTMVGGSRTVTSPIVLTWVA